MAQGVEFEGMNAKLGAPPGDEDRVYALPVFRNGHCVVSCFELSDEELAEVNKTKRIYMSLLSGPSMPPAYLTARREDMRVFLLDWGGSF